MPRQRKVRRQLPRRHTSAERWRARPSVGVHVHLLHRFIPSVGISVRASWKRRNWAVYQPDELNSVCLQTLTKVQKSDTTMLYLEPLQQTL